jgi:hypothetical protein
MALKTETNTPAIERQVLAAARKCLYRGRSTRLTATFEHGQWWVTREETGAQWSVVDASGPGSYNGLGFERVTRGDDE